MPMCLFVWRITCRPPPQCVMCASTVNLGPESSFGGVRIADRVRKTVPSGRTDKKPGGRTCWVGDVVRAVDFAQRNGDVSGWTVGRSARRGTEMHDRSDIDGPWPPAWTSHNLWRLASGASHGAAASVHDQTFPCCRWRVRQHWALSQSINHEFLEWPKYSKHC